MSLKMARRVLVRVVTVGFLLLTGCEHEPPTGGGTGFVQTFEIQIGRDLHRLPGRRSLIDVTLNHSYYELAGFDLKFLFDASALHCMAAIPGDFYTFCDWEYFSYDYKVVDSGYFRGAGVLDVHALADVGDDNRYRFSGCEAERMNDGPVVLFTIDFLVDDNPNLECAYLPVRFFWEDCADNTVTYRSRLFGGRGVTAAARGIADLDDISIADMHTGFPTLRGFQEECYGRDRPPGSAPVRLVDLLNGGVDIFCWDGI